MHVQFCGVNVIAYYSSEIFVKAGFSELSALGASMGFGVINFLFAIPAVYTIDTFGRRNLLLVTFPLMALCLFFTGFSFWIPEDSTAHIAVRLIKFLILCPQAGACCTNSTNRDYLFISFTEWKVNFLITSALHLVFTFSG